jgi:hypothetical protein
MIEYNVEKPDEPEFFQTAGNWYRRQWRLSMFQSVIVLKDDGKHFVTDKNVTLISFWNSDTNHTERHSMPNTWEWA